MYGYYYGYYDLWLFFIPLLIALWAQSRVQSAYRKYSRVNNTRNYTGAQMARLILDQNGLQHVRVEHIRGNLTDHFDPRDNVVRLSDGVYHSATVSAVGIAAHECGHAVQHAQGYGPLKLRSAIIPLTNFGTRIAVPLAFAGLLFGLPSLLLIGLVGYALIALFQMVTLPVEFNASSRAMSVITYSGMFTEEEQKGVHKVLSAAALTYVAALITSLTQLLRLLLIYNRRR